MIILTLGYVVSSANVRMIYPSFVCLFLCLLAGKLEKLSTILMKFLGWVRRGTN